MIFIQFYLSTSK